MLNYLLGRSEFQERRKVIASIRKFERFNKSEKLDEASALPIFRNATQQSWLIFTSHRMYFVLDDTEKQHLKALWARDKENMVQDNRVNLHLKEAKYSEETGALYFGNMNNRVLFTYSLFKKNSLAGQILSLAEKHFLKHRDGC